MSREANNAALGYDAEIALAGNPNVGKSTVFNALTGLRQHTGNWSGKTVENAYGRMRCDDTVYRVVDLPGAYSLNALSKEEDVAREYLMDEKDRVIVAVADASNLARNLLLVLEVLSYTERTVLCLNMMDEASRKGIVIDCDELSLRLGVPVVPVCAKKKSTLKSLRETVHAVASGDIRTFRVRSLELDRIMKIEDEGERSGELYRKIDELCRCCVVHTRADENIRDRRLDRVLTSKVTGIPVMLLLFGALFWITAVGANYPSAILSQCFGYLGDQLSAIMIAMHFHPTLQSLLMDGVYTTLTWVVAVMFPPMAIFFPLFSLMEDSGYLPRIAFNMDGVFYRYGASPKQCLTMAMGIGCNACGVMGCRIIDKEHERRIAIVTNALMPCNGRLPALLAIISVFFSMTDSVMLNSLITAAVMVVLLVLSVIITLLSSSLLSKTLYRGSKSGFILELPPYRRPKILETIWRSLADRALFVLLRAVYVAIPAGAIIWCIANIEIHGASILSYLVGFFDRFAFIIGVDGAVIMAFLLGFPANETVIPVLLMSYLSASVLTDYSSYDMLHTLLIHNGWTALTAVCFLTLCLFHFPCSTTCLTIHKETGSITDTLTAFLLPTVIGVILCMLLTAGATLARIVF